MGSFDYTKKVTIPEHGICLDLLTHLVIDRFGDVYPCVRFNPHKINRLGNLNQSSLEGLWNGELRKNLIQEHIKNNRKCNELCSKCDFYGCPTSL
jgi:radical SAM protein with 4Fe4S-binding SPASM domain